MLMLEGRWLYLEIHREKRENYKWSYNSQSLLPFQKWERKNKQFLSQCFPIKWPVQSSITVVFMRMTKGNIRECHMEMPKIKHQLDPSKGPCHQY